MFSNKNLNFPYVSSPLKRDVYLVRLLIILGLLLTSSFLFWLLNNGQSDSVILFTLFFSAFCFRIIKWWQEWYHYWSPTVPDLKVSGTLYTVDVFTTYCKGEPKDMIIKTLSAILNIRYPHNTFLCDESDDPMLRSFCVKHNIHYVTRKLKIDAKAGNINNALKISTADIVLILDPDHVPVPEFLDRVLPYFDNPKVGYVQCIQSYYNQHDSHIARAAAEQSFHFYGPMMMSMHTYGTVQAIGANCTFRRSALDDIGGHATGLAEDMHTAMRLHAKGWQSVYIPEALSKGLAPSTVSAYFKQQLKWARGVFELLFTVYFKVFFDFNWRQKLHYLTCSVFFLTGIFQFIEYIVPLISLGFSISPLKINGYKFLFFFFAVLLVVYSIRVFVQRWLPEKSEKGFHWMGGILLMGSWWVFIIGFLYSIFKIRVPYIPTPKEDSVTNEWLICIPNIILILASVIILVLGIERDLTPYSLIMALILLIQLVPSIVLVLLAQNKIILNISVFFNGFKANIFNYIQHIISRINNLFYLFFEKGFSFLVVFFIALSFLILSNEKKYFHETNRSFIGLSVASEKIYFSGKKQYVCLNTAQEYSAKMFSLNVCLAKNELNNVDIVSLYCKNNKISPFVNLVPADFNSYSIDETLKAIIYGYFDEELSKLGRVMLDFHRPVFIGLFSNIKYNVHHEVEFKLAWKYLFEYYNRMGLSNLVWIWLPDESTGNGYFPGRSYIDCIGLTESTNKSGSGMVIRSALLKNEILQNDNIPVLLMKYCTIDKRINSLTILNYKKGPVPDFSLIITSMLDIVSMNSQLNNNIFSFDNLLNNLTTDTIGACENNWYSTDIQSEKSLVTRCSSIKKDFKGSFSFYVNDVPFFIRGVAYNTGHDWRDGSQIPSRSRLSEDFKLIKSMGANVIRRYGSGIYDKNILNIAHENGLMVQFGFWFDPQVDYYKDKSAVEEYFHEVENNVRKWKDHPAVLMWSIGNECWGQLKHHFQKPYLIKVRQQYILMLEKMTRLIHEIDSLHPVITCLEHEESQLPSELIDLRRFAPSLDAIGINSYYEGQISKLDSVFFANDTTRPYLVSEFGPNGYWNDHYNNMKYGRLIEQNSLEKANWYVYQWRNFVLLNRGKTLGGIAYCWKDRLEGTLTWFGITDFENRLKPAYWALRNEWGEDDIRNEIYNEDFSVVSIRKNNYMVYTLSAKKQHMKVKWEVFQNEFLEPYDEIFFSEKGDFLFVKMPISNKNLRVFAYVSDENNNVITCSVPVYFQKYSFGFLQVMASSP